MTPLRTRIFVDFWNLQLNIYDQVGRSYRLDWKKISPLLISEGSTLLGTPLHFEGTHVYLSYDPTTSKGKGLRTWAINTLDRFPGIRVIAKERKAKSPPTCPTCHRSVDTCPYCKNRMVRTVEKGIDTAIVTDMISLAWENAWDAAILVSSDRDYIPLVELLANKGLKVINAYFAPQGVHLARTCWASIDLRPHLVDLAR